MSRAIAAVKIADKFIRNFDKYMGVIQKDNWTFDGKYHKILVTQKIFVNTAREKRAYDTET